MLSAYQQAAEEEHAASTTSTGASRGSEIVAVNWECALPALCTLSLLQSRTLLHRFLDSKMSTHGQVLRRWQLLRALLVPASNFASYTCTPVSLLGCGL